MNVNMTLLGQMITFFLFILFTMKYVWPPIIKALEDRQKKIAEGLQSAERSENELVLAQQKAKEIIDEAKLQAAVIVDQANTRGVHMDAEARKDAYEAAERIKRAATLEMEHQLIQARDALSKDVVEIAMMGSQKLVSRHIDSAANEDILNALIQDLERKPLSIKKG
jgi:F-type H+-transporting ATPase subunit b